MMKGDALLINGQSSHSCTWLELTQILFSVGRGTTVDTEALVRALTAKQRPDELVDQAGSLRIGAAALE